MQALPRVSEVGSEPRACVLSPSAALAPSPLPGTPGAGDAGRVNLPFPQVTDDALVYSTFLLQPRPAGSLSILGTNPKQKSNRVPLPQVCVAAPGPEAPQQACQPPGSTWQRGCEGGEGLGLWSPPSVLKQRWLMPGLCREPPETGRGHSCLLGGSCRAALPLSSEGSLGRAGWVPSSDLDHHNLHSVAE